MKKYELFDPKLITKEIKVKQQKELLESSNEEIFEIEYLRVEGNIR